MKANIEIDCSNPEKVIKSLEPDIDENGKFDVQLTTDKNIVKIKVESEDISGLLAGINSYLRLIKITKDLEEIK